MKGPERRNLDAEVRAVTEGHRAYVQPGGWVRVVSDRYEGTGKHYRVDVLPTAPGRGITFVCQPQGYAAFEQDHQVLQAEPGVAGCKHAAVAARRLEREGLAVLADGLWRCPGELLERLCACGARARVRDQCASCRLARMLGARS